MIDLDINIIDIEETTTNKESTKKTIKKRKISFSKILTIITFLLVVGASGTAVGFIKEKTTVLKSLSKNGNEIEEQIINQSNKLDKKKMQIEVVTEFVNVRKTPSSLVDSIGKVYEKEIYDILSVSTDEYYVWYEIKTASGLHGYVATYQIDSPGFEKAYLKRLT